MQTIEKRNKLMSYCCSMECARCRLNSICRCGRGSTFISHDKKEIYDIPKTEIDIYYEIAFGGDKNENRK